MQGTRLRFLYFAPHVSESWRGPQLDRTQAKAKFEVPGGTLPMLGWVVARIPSSQALVLHPLVY